MIAAVACCPCTALLVPAAGTGVASEIDPLRAAAARAVGQLVAAGVDAVVVLGPAELSQPLRNFVPGLLLPPFAALPLPQALAWYLLDDAGATSARRYLAVTPASRGVLDLAGAPSERVGVLVMADGTARRGEKAPGYLDPRAAPFDDAVAAALGTADLERLAALDPALGADLLSFGVGPWRALAAAASTQRWDAELLYSDAPFGVGYVVATWTPG
jgi:hypothetical protein